MDATLPASLVRAVVLRELPVWRREGLVDDATSAALARRYQDADGRSLALSAVFLFGALLCGAGALAFVAWNWAALPALARLGLVGGAMIAAQAGGLALKRRGSGVKGEALLLFGGLLFGAMIGLLAQTFHVGSSGWPGLLLFGAGNALVGALARSRPVQLCGAIIAGVAGALAIEDVGVWAWAVPWLFALPVFGLALLERSRALAFVSAAGLLALQAAAVAGRLHDPEPAVFAFLAAAALVAAVAAAGRPGRPVGALAGALSTAASIALLPTLFCLSFHGAAEELAEHVVAAPTALALALGPTTLAVALVLLRAGRAGLRRQPTAVALALAALGALAVGLVGDEDGRVLSIFCNAALVALGALGLVTGARHGERRTLWSGLALLVGTALARFLELETGLGLKAAAFFGAGLVVIVTGLVLERRLVRPAPEVHP